MAEEEVPEPSKLIDPSHKMSSWSDLPFACEVCGACECHYFQILLRPCVKTFHWRVEQGD